jgi:hypothetical protein
MIGNTKREDAKTQRLRKEDKKELKRQDRKDCQGIY